MNKAALVVLLAVVLPACEFCTDCDMLPPAPTFDYDASSLSAEPNRFLYGEPILLRFRVVPLYSGSGEVALWGGTTSSYSPLGIRSLCQPERVSASKRGAR